MLIIWLFINIVYSNFGKCGAKIQIIIIGMQVFIVK